MVADAAEFRSVAFPTPKQSNKKEKKQRTDTQKVWLTAARAAALAGFPITALSFIGTICP